MKDKNNNKWYSVAHSMPVLGRDVLFYFPALNNIAGKFSAKIETGRMETPKRYGVGGERLESRASCDYYAEHRDITHWAEIGTQGVPNDTGFVFTLNMMCLNPIEMTFSTKKQRRIIRVAEICGYWFYGFSWEYDNGSGYSSGCRPGKTSAKKNFRTKEEAIAQILTFHREKDKKHMEKDEKQNPTKQLSLF